jgi:proteasome regulatory subunit
MKSTDENGFESVGYSYTTEVPKLEEENRVLKDTIKSLNNELDKLRELPYLVCELREIIDNKAIIKLPNGNTFYVNVASECGPLEAGDTVLVEQKNLTVIRKIPSNKRYNVEQFVIIEKPNIKWEDIGGLDQQIQEIQEVIELPLKKPELFKKMGISPPKGILLYGPPGTGKTLLAKAVADSTNSTFIEIVSSELVQKFIGEGAKLVKEIFQLAKEKAPSIIFIDELDALAAVRVDLGTSGEREVQRTFMQLLSEIDGFKALGDVKVIGCTNRKDILDPAILRPGRLDRLIQIPLPDPKAREQIFKIHSRNMPVEKDVPLKNLNLKMDSFTGAEIRAVCTEAGYFAIRESRSTVGAKDFEKAITKVRQEAELEGQDYLNMFG